MKRRLTAALFLCALLPSLAAGTVNLLDEARRSNYAFYWDSLSATGMLEKDGRYVIFRADDPFMLLDYQTLAVTDAPVLNDGTLFVSQGFLDSVNRFFAVPNAKNMLIPGYKVGAIVIDPGHGGKDPGTVSDVVINGKKTTLHEKDITLSVSRKLYALLKQAYPDKQILLTRNDDRFLELEQRSKIANSVNLKENETIVFISIHVNSSPSNKPTGFEVWYLPPEYRRRVIDSAPSEADNDLFNIFNAMTEEEYTLESQQISKYIMDGLDTAIGDKIPRRKIREEAWSVVANSKMPSVLVEIGFLSNDKEALLLIDGNHQQKTALGIFQGIADFIRHYENARGVIARTGL
jgi:N-acetylmuramoyl-L-alanine amidase